MLRRVLPKRLEIELGLLNRTNSLPVPSACPMKVPSTTLACHRICAAEEPADNASISSWVESNP
jgi:hypothetical protein